jgi:UDP-galactopyranose mutase
VKYTIVGAGLTGSVIAHELHSAGHDVRVFERRDHVGGNCHTEQVGEIHVHRYGAHVFHTNSNDIWDYVNRLVEMVPYRHRVRAFYEGRYYTLPLNLTTFHEILGIRASVKAATEAMSKLPEPGDNLEGWILSRLPRRVYEVLIEGYTKKQWGNHPRNLPASIIKRIPIRLNCDDGYYDSTYCGIPANGYTPLFKRLLDGVDVTTGAGFGMADLGTETTICTGPIDEFFDYELGRLEYRSLHFEHSLHFEQYCQGFPVVNYTSIDTPFTRTIEHKHFGSSTCGYTVLTHEYPELEGDPHYPITDARNSGLYNIYKSYATKEFPNVVFAGRLGAYVYIDMDQAIARALDTVGGLLT